MVKHGGYKDSSEIIPDEQSSWLVEKAGLATVDIEGDKVVYISSFAQKLLGIKKYPLEKNLFFRKFDDPLEDFKKFINEDTDLIIQKEFNLKIKNRSIRVFVKKAAKTNPVNLLFLETKKEGAPDKSIKEASVLNKILSKYPVDTESSKIIEDILKQLTITKASIDNNRTPVYWFNRKGDIKYVNRAAWELLGYSENELYKLKIYDLSDNINPNNWPSRWELIKISKTAVTETLHKRKDGTKIPVEIRTDFLSFFEEEYVIAYFRDISERKESLKKLEYRQKFERLIFEISAQFINVSADNVNSQIDAALKRICDFSGSDSAHIYMIEHDNRLLSRKNYYCFNDSDKQTKDELYISFEYNEDDWIYSEINKRKVVQIKNIQKLKSASTIKKIFTYEKIKSSIYIGLFYQKKLLGILGLSSKISEKVWSDDEANLLQVIGDIFIYAVQRKESVKKLINSEQTYREIYNVTNEAIFIHNPETGKIEDVNKAMLTMFDVSYEEALNKSVEELSEGILNPELGSALDIIRKAKEEPQFFEWTMTKKDGKIFFAEVYVKKAVIHGQIKVMSVVHDITERKNTEALLKEREENYRMIIEGQNDLIVKLDTKGKFLFVSKSYCKMFNKSEEELLGKEFMPQVHEDDRETTKLAMENLFKQPYSCYLEQRAITHDGWRWLAWNDTAVFDDIGNIKEIIGVGRDITYQKMVENALRESEERFRSIVQNLSDVVFLLDEHANVKYVTPSCQEYLGDEIDVFLNNKITEFIHPDDVSLTINNIKQHLEGVDYYNPYEIRMKHSTSAWRMFEVKSQNMLNHPAVKSIIYTISDITERKQMEKQVLDAIIKTEEKERARFAKDLHDDLGPLLSSIKMYVGMLEKSQDKEKKEYITKNLTAIVKEAITTTKDVSNDLNPHVLNNYGLGSAIGLFIEKITSDINIKFDQNIENARYTAAIELSLYRITKELINNTLKHAKAKNILIKLTEYNGKLSLYYEDDGRGISENKLIQQKTSNMGLSNIISRAKSLNAIYNFYTDIPEGFKFDMHVPLLQV